METIFEAKEYSGLGRSARISQYLFWSKELNAKQGCYNNGISGHYTHSSCKFCRNSIHGDFISQKKRRNIIQIHSHLSALSGSKAESHIFLKRKRLLYFGIHMLLKFESLNKQPWVLRIKIKCHYSLFQCYWRMLNPIFSVNSIVRNYEIVWFFENFIFIALI